MKIQKSGIFYYFEVFLGVILVILGIIGLIMPIIPGFLLIFFGLILVGARKLVKHIKQGFKHIFKK